MAWRVPPFERMARPSAWRRTDGRASPLAGPHALTCIMAQGASCVQVHRCERQGETGGRGARQERSVGTPYRYRIATNYNTAAVVSSGRPGKWSRHRDSTPYPGVRSCYRPRYLTHVSRPATRDRGLVRARVFEFSELSESSLIRINSRLRSLRSCWTSSASRTESVAAAPLGGPSAFIPAIIHRWL